MAVQDDLQAPIVINQDSERRQLTILSCHVAGLSALSSRLDPEDLREVYAGCHACIREIISRYEGFAAKCIADEVQAYPGYPRSAEDDAERAVRAGLEVAEAVSGLKIEHANERLRARASHCNGPCCSWRARQGWRGLSSNR